MRIWTIAEPELLQMLRDVAGGEHPDVVMAEAYANADIEDRP